MLIEGQSFDIINIKGVAMSDQKKPQPVYLKSYQPTAYRIEHCDLSFDLQDNHVTVTSVLRMSRREGVEEGAMLVLHGLGLTLVSIEIDQRPLMATGYTYDGEVLKIPHCAQQFVLRTVVHIEPSSNTALMGLYQSGKNLYTQCEPEGFRRITFFYDRPDMMTRFTTTILADQSKYPVLLSNGNLVRSDVLADGRHMVRWEDPSLKPCYLFALVAGDFNAIEDHFITMNGRRVELKMYLDKGTEHMAYHAMESLKKSMKWDELVYQREYDLDIFMVVAVGDFNFGAMENKGLNIFNSKCILASPDVATDEDYITVQGVIAHEYFHNWSGNRVTCRDWFQITLKEGLTVFRDQSFTADHTSQAVSRIYDVIALRQHQFPEDAGPLSHPIRPESYIEINNFYTSTVYNKGAEVIRMIATMLGQTVFLNAMQVYFSRFDGMAVTTEDFVQVMEDASSKDLSQFKRWYSQSGTPIVRWDFSYDQQKQTLRLHMSQSCPETPGQGAKLPFVIPVKMGLLALSGDEVSFVYEGKHFTETVLILNQEDQTWVFEGVEQEVIPSLFRDFSAPIIERHPLSEAQLLVQMQCDKNLFKRWEASEQYKLGIMKLSLDHPEKTGALVDNLISMLKQYAQDFKRDPYYFALLLQLPNERALLNEYPGADLDQVLSIVDEFHQQVGLKMRNEWLRLYQSAQAARQLFQFAMKDVGYRSIQAVALNYLSYCDDDNIRKMAFDQYKQADNLTDRLSALEALNRFESSFRQAALDDFYKRFHQHPLVLDRYFALCASAPLSGTFDAVKSLLDHKDFSYTNPNRVRALLGTFAMRNMKCFHDQMNPAYDFLIEQVKILDASNPQLATRVIHPMTYLNRFDSLRAEKMRESMESLVVHPLSSDLYEVVKKVLDDAPIA